MNNTTEMMVNPDKLCEDLKNSITTNLDSSYFFNDGGYNIFVNENCNDEIEVNLYKDKSYMQTLVAAHPLPEDIQELGSQIAESLNSIVGSIEN